MPAGKLTFQVELPHPSLTGTTSQSKESCHKYTEIKVFIHNPFSPVDLNNTHTNSVDPDEMAHNEPSHQDLHCLPFWSNFLSDIPICSNGCVQIQWWESPLQKLRGEKIDSL